MQNISEFNTNITLIIMTLSSQLTKIACHAKSSNIRQSEQYPLKVS